MTSRAGGEPVTSRASGGQSSRLGGPRLSRLQVALLVGVPVVLLLAAACWVGIRGALAVEHLQRAAAVVPAVRGELAAGDVRAARPQLDTFAADAAAAHRLTADPIFAAATRLPRIGSDLSALATVCAVSDRLATGVVAPLTGPSGLPALTRARAAHAGTAPLVGALAAAREPLQQAHRQLRSGMTKLAGVDTTRLDPQVAGPVAELAQQLRTADTGLDTAVRAAQVLPAMLGGDQPRTYLVLFQNLAEARSLGGVPSAFAVVRAQHGQLTLIRQGSSADIPSFAEPVLDIGADSRQAFLGQPGRHLQDVTATPWFPDAARIAREMWRRRSGQQVDGVIATDPVMLSELMRVTGPVAVPGAGMVGADRIVPLVLHQVYLRYRDPAAQDRFFAATAAAAFSALSDYHGDPVALARAAASGIAQGRLLVWDADPRVRAGLSGTVLAGVPGGNAAAGAQRPLVGVYLNDATGSKMSWYLHREVSVTQRPRLSDGRRPLRMHLLLTSSAPTSGLPDYVTGGRSYGVSPGSMQVTVFVIGSGAGSLISARVDGREVPLSSHRVHGRPLGGLTVLLPPGAHRTVEVDLLAPPGQGSPRLDLQPMVPGPTG